jgi:hypothetical protein
MATVWPCDGMVQGQSSGAGDVYVRGSACPSTVPSHAFRAASTSNVSTASSSIDSRSFFIVPSPCVGSRDPMRRRPSVTRCR